MLNRNPTKRPQAGDMLKDKLLIQIMINRINQTSSLKQEYTRGHQLPSLSNSVIDRQADFVRNQLKMLELEVGEKMMGLKEQKI